MAVSLPFSEKEEGRWTAQGFRRKIVCGKLQVEVGSETADVGCIRNPSRDGRRPADAHPAFGNERARVGLMAWWTRNAKSLITAGGEIVDARFVEGSVSVVEPDEEAAMREGVLDDKVR